MLKFFIVFGLFFFSSNVIAQNNDYFLMLKYNKVNVRYGPNKDDQIKFVYKKKFLPLKVVDKKENFRKIIDHKKNSGWIHRSQLKKSKSIVVLSTKVIFKNPTKYSKPIAKLEKGRLLIIKKCKFNWCKVETGNYTGWIDVENVWGKPN